MSVAIDYVFEDVKEELSKKGWRPVRQESSVRLYEEEYEVPHIQKFPLRSFVSDGKIVVSKKPVEIILFLEGNKYYAENNALKIYAVGDSIKSVIQEFSHHIVHFFDYYRGKGHDEVTGRAVKLKAIYDAHFNTIQP